MHEDLVGYLLGALEPEEMRRIAQWLRESPEARAELARIETSLRPLEELTKEEWTEKDPAESDSTASDRVSRALDSLPPLPVPEQPIVALTPMSDGVERPGRPSMTWSDWVSGSVAAAILLGLLLPAIAQGRFESRKAACQDQLRQFGTALIAFVDQNPKNQLPAVQSQGREAFAGVYSLRLHDSGLLTDPGLRWCPSLNPPSETERSAAQPMSLAKLYSEPVDRLQQIQKSVGGHYSYSLGVFDHQKHTAPEYESRSTFAVMSDAPIAPVGPQIGNANSPQFGHSGEGINVLFEDGHTQFIPVESLDSIDDNPLQNHRGIREAGVDTNDASLGPSWQAPFLDADQQ